jgi:hypothetical protein
MTKEQYLAYRDKKCEQFLQTIKQHLGNLTEEQIKAMEFGFKKGMDTATAGGKHIKDSSME